MSINIIIGENIEIKELEFFLLYLKSIDRVVTDGLFNKNKLWTVCLRN